jgi:predicted dehydrogenase
MEKINWGIIGCGDVTEVKSGPAFNKVPRSTLMAVMRRDADKAADYAKRHNVHRWYNNAAALINDPDVNAIYIATPPAWHEAYALQAIAAGKPVYVEKPMALNYAAAKNIATFAAEKNVKLCVAHYRRQQPLFKKIKQLLHEEAIGAVRLIELKLHKTLYTDEQLTTNFHSWRVNPLISGGGLFYDLAPHQLDILYYFFGGVKAVKGFSLNQAGVYGADDIVAGSMLFENGILFNGNWCFNAAQKADECLITGSNGSICFSMFNYTPVELTVNNNTQLFPFEPLQHVQQPLIEQVVQYFLDKAANPCSGDEGAAIMGLMENFTLAE